MRLPAACSIMPALLLLKRFCRPSPVHHLLLASPSQNDDWAVSMEACSSRPFQIRTCRSCSPTHLCMHCSRCHNNCPKCPEQVALLKSASAARDALQAQNAALQRECARLSEAAGQAEAAGEAGQQLRDDLDTSRAEAASLEAQLEAASSELERIRGALDPASMYSLHARGVLASLS